MPTRWVPSQITMFSLSQNLCNIYVISKMIQSHYLTKCIHLARKWLESHRLWKSVPKFWWFSLEIVGTNLKRTTRWVVWHHAQLVGVAGQQRNGLRSFEACDSHVSTAPILAIRLGGEVGFRRLVVGLFLGVAHAVDWAHWRWVLGGVMWRPQNSILIKKQDICTLCD